MSNINELVRFIKLRRHIITIILALVAIGIEYFYTICKTTCSPMRGDIFGIQLEYIGVAYMLATIGFSLLRKDTLLLVLLSCGVGIELYLVAFQIWHNTYCSYCLAFGAILMSQFFVNSDWKRKRLILGCMIMALFLFSLVFKAGVKPIYTEKLHFWPYNFPQNLDNLLSLVFLGYWTVYSEPGGGRE